MRLIIMWTVLTLLSQSGFSQSGDVEILKKLNKDWINSYPTRDSATLNAIFADDFVLIKHRGTKMTKKDVLAGLGRQETLSAKIDSVDVKLLTENVGVVTAYTTFVLKADGKEMIGQNCYQDIYVKRKGKWVAVTAHVTLLSLK